MLGIHYLKRSAWTKKLQLFFRFLHHLEAIESFVHCFLNPYVFLSLHVFVHSSAQKSSDSRKYKETYHQYFQMHTTLLLLSSILFYEQIAIECKTVLRI